MRKTSIAIRGLVALACAAPISGCLTPAAEQRIGQNEEARLEQTIGLSDHAVSTVWVEQVGRRVAAQAPPGVEYRFHVLDMEEPNAFALPGGPVYISRGLLAFLNSEDELAGVLGHEIGHIAERHAASRQAVATPIAILLGLPAAIVGGIAPGLGSLARLPAEIAGGAAIASYSRGQEHAADRLGVTYAAAAGYEPAGLASALEALERELALEGTSEGRPSFFANHPGTPDRIERVREQARQVTPRARIAVAAERVEVLDRLAGLMVGPNPRNGIFEGDDFLHPELAFRIRLPAEWTHLNLPEAVASLPDPDRRDVYLTLRLAGDGDDPLDIFGEKGPDPEVAERIERREIGGLPAAHIAVESEGSVVDLTWLAYGGRIYAVTGVAPIARAAGFIATCRRVADSFAPLDAVAVESIPVRRVAVVESRGTESVADLARRSDSVADAAWVAAANGWPAARPMDSGRPMKVVVERPYASGP